MFDSPCKFALIGRWDVDSSGLFDNKGVIENFLFKFKLDDGIVYHIRVNRYDMDIFMIKFYCQQHENHPYKYNILLNKRKASRVLATCHRVIVEYFIPKYEFGAFGFIGAPSLYANGSMELRQYTKRFRIYSHMVSIFHGLNNFEHFKDDNLSAYLIFPNSSRKETQKKLAFELFALNYPESE